MSALVSQEARRARPLAITRMCRVLGLSRATYYRHRRGRQRRGDREGPLRARLRALAGHWPAYGHRRLTYALRRQGWGVHPKRVLRLMREEQLLCSRRKRRVRTTCSEHRWPIYPNLTAALRVSRCNQLWVADLTYLRLRGGFGYLAVILAAWSRRCLGWALAPSLGTDVALQALRMALASRRVPPGLIHHSDRGVQYASRAYTAVLTAHSIRISMSRRGTPSDNAQAESFFKTLKAEEIYRWEYQDLAEARARIGHFLHTVYNRQRLHSALGYRPPVEFEQTLGEPTSA